MHPIKRQSTLAFAALAALALASPGLAAQASDSSQTAEPLETVAQAEDGRPRGLVTRDELIEDRLRRMGVVDPDPAPRRPTSRADSLAWEGYRRAAARATGRRI